MQILKIARLNLSINMYLPFLLASCLFVTPLSSTLKSILVPLSILSCLLDSTTRNILFKLCYKPWVIATLLLFIYALIACLWSNAAVKEKLLILEKYSKLLYLPVLAAGFSHPKARKWGMLLFLSAMVITSIGGIIKVTYFYSPYSENVFRNHIMTGHMVAFAAYISLLLFVAHEKNRWVYIGLFILFTYQMFFINEGRTGYVIYALLMTLFIFQTYSWKKSLLAMAVFISCLTLIYLENSIVQKKISFVLLNIEQYQQKIKDTPIGYRLQFQEFAKKMFLKHPIEGNGTGSFTHQFGQDKPVPSWTRRLLEPHSQYWLIAAEFGVLGIGLFFAFLLLLFLEALKLKDMRAIGLGILIPFIIGNASDSLLLYSGSGYFFILFMALALGEEYVLYLNNNRAC